MADFTWSQQQLSAITASGSDVLVSAAAGSGKTTVLTERLLRQILAGTDLSTILVVTFTEAAASHMRSSISKALRNRISTTEDTAERAMLKAQLAKLPSANIKTLHSFCLDLTREHFAYTDMDLNSRVLDDNESKLLKADVLTEILDRESHGPNAHQLEGLLPLLAKSKSGDALLNHIQKLYDLVWEQPFPYLWMERALANYDQSAADGVWFDLLKSQLFPYLTSALDGLHESLSDLCHVFRSDLGNLAINAPTVTDRKAADLEKQLAIYEPALSIVREALQNLNIDTPTWDSISQTLEQLQRLSVPALRWSKLDPHLLDIKESMKTRRDRVAAICSSIPVVSYQELRDCLAEQRPHLEYLFYLVSQYAEGYKAAKQESSSIDFGDMQRGAMELLWQLDKDAGIARITPVAESIRSQYTQIMEDEYQDSNNLQEWILRAISDGPVEVPLDQDMTADMTSPGPHMFMVGDIKQSIYGFRNAEPSLFISKYATYGRESTPGQVVDLQGNYRSTPRILEAVNTVFQRNMSLRLGGSDYDHRARLLPGLTSPDTECHQDYNQPVDYYCVDTDFATSADAMVHIIQDAVTNRMFYDYKLKSWRKYTYSDIAILQRAIKSDGQEIKQALDAAGIPSHLSENITYLGTYEVQTVISALRITDNPLQDKDLLAVAFSPMFDMPGAVPALLKTLFPNGPYYYDRMTAMAEANLGDSCYSSYDSRFLSDAQNYCQHIVSTIASWRSLSKQLAPERLIWHIITSTGFYNIVETMSNGITRTANLRLLFSYAVKYSSTSLKGITNFIRFLEKVVSQKSDLAALQPLAENSVTITTIHKSKGLEFPLVIVGNMRSRFIHEDYSGALIKNSSLGLAVKRYDYSQNCLYPGPTYRLLSNEIKRESRSEELRVLYVALTRAQNHLALIDEISMEKVDEDRDKILEDLPENASCYGKWVLPVAIRNPGLFNLQSFDGPEELSPDAIISAVPAVNAELSDTFRQDILLPDLKPYDYTQAPSKVSVTRIERMFGPVVGDEPLFTAVGIETPEDEPMQDNLPQGELSSSLNDFIQGMGAQPITAPVRGTINHLFMEKLDFARTTTMDELEAQLRELELAGVFSPEESQTINLAGVHYACNLEELRHLLTTCPLHRESSFNMLVDYESLMESKDVAILGQYLPERASTLMQGIIDLWIESAPGEAVLVDYKTGRCSPENLILYKRQLDMYATALTRLTGRQVTAKYVVFLDEKKVHSL